jgi:predicted phosphoadenosine phosphosulfate sulfurtransferase
VAVLTGEDPVDTGCRKYLKPKRDYASSNRVGTRGVIDSYFLVPGVVYLVQRRESWARTTRFFATVEGGEVQEVCSAEEVGALSREERVAWLAKLRTRLVPPPPPAMPAAVGVDVGRKRHLGVDVLTAAKQRIHRVFSDFPRVYVSFSGGKDSTVMLHLVAEAARARRRKVGLLFVDLEAQYLLTVEHVQHLFREYADVVDPYWVALPLALRNAVSSVQPRWQCWDPDARALWVREPPPEAITTVHRWDWFRPGMEFEEFVEDFGHWYSQGRPTCCLVGIRTQESLNRWRAIAGTATRHEGLPWTTWKGDGVFNAYPIYDWRTEDLWTYFARTGKPYNALYDRMHQAGLTVHQMRICQPYGDDQRKGLWLYHVVEPETWGRVVARVAGANSGALYAQEKGNILGRLQVTKPEGHTWQSFARLLLETMPETSAEHYRNKVAVFLKWWTSRGYPDGIPDEAPSSEEASKETPSWRRVCKALLRNDYWCKGLSFTQTKSEAYAKYQRVMKARRQMWRLNL